MQNWPLCDVDESGRGQLVAVRGREETCSVLIDGPRVGRETSASCESRVRRSGHACNDGSNAHPVSFFNLSLSLASVYLCTGSMCHEKPSP